MQYSRIVGTRSTVVRARYVVVVHTLHQFIRGMTDLRTSRARPCTEHDTSQQITVPGTYVCTNNGFVCAATHVADARNV